MFNKIKSICLYLYVFKNPTCASFLETGSRLERAAVLNDDADHFRLVFSACDQGHGAAGGAAKHAVKINFAEAAAGCTPGQ